jgi:hypothetical protein
MMCMYASRRRLLWNARQSTGSPRSVGRSWKWRREEEDANGAWCRKPWESAPVSTTASAWHHQQHPIIIFPNNKETKKQHALSFLPSFVFTHFLLFPRPARRSSSPRVRERDPRHNTRIGGHGKQASPSSQKTLEKSFLSLCAASRHDDDDAQSQVLMRSSCLLLLQHSAHSCVQFRLLRAAASKQASSLPVGSEFLRLAICIRCHA